MSILSSVALGWIGRRILDVGGWAGGVLWVILKTYDALPPVGQELVGKALQGHWQELTLGGAAGLVAWLWSQRDSFIATVRPQIVTNDGRKVELNQIPAPGQAVVESAAATATPRRKSLADLLAEKLSRR